MQQSDAAFKCLLCGSSTRNREMHGSQLLRCQIFVVMAFVGQRESSRQRPQQSGYEQNAFHERLRRKRV